MTAKECKFFIDTYCLTLTKNADEKFERRDFILRPYQRDVVDAFFTGKNLVIEKTRQTGLSWLFAAIYAYILIFGSNEQLLVLGKNEAFVDDSELNPNTLLGKVKFILKNLKSKPLRFIVEKTIVMKYLFLKNIGSNTIVNGSSAASSSGRGSTYTSIWWDETAFTEKDAGIFASIGPNSSQIVFISTPNGKNNLFYKLREKIEGGNLGEDWRLIRVWWKDYPQIFSEAWYRGQCEVLSHDPVLIARELDIDYEGSGSDRVFYTIPQTAFRSVPFERRLAGYSVIAFDYGIRDYTSAVLIQYHPTTGEFRIPDGFILQNVPFETILKALVSPGETDIEEIRRRSPADMFSGFYRFWTNARTHGYGRLAMTGDPAGSARDIRTGYSIADLFFELGIPYVTFREKQEAVLSKIRGHSDRIFIDRSIEAVRDCVSKWAYAVNSDGLPTKPKHDEFSHMGTGMIYGFNYVFRSLMGGIQGESPRKEKEFWE